MRERGLFPLSPILSTLSLSISLMSLSLAILPSLAIFSSLSPLSLSLSCACRSFLHALKKIYSPPFISLSPMNFSFLSLHASISPLLCACIPAFFVILLLCHAHKRGEMEACKERKEKFIGEREINGGE